MANWFEVRAGTMTEAAGRAYFGRPTHRGQFRHFTSLLGGNRWGVDNAPELPVPADRDR